MSKTAKPRKIALFGISADPPTGHGGHLGIVEYFCSARLFDEIWVLPVYRHIYDSKQKLQEYEHRLNMCTTSMEPLSREDCEVKVMSMEREVCWYCEKMHGTNYKIGTVDVLKYIISKYENVALSLILGSDTFSDLANGKWKDAARYELVVRFTSCVSIFNIVDIHVTKRKGIEIIYDEMKVKTDVYFHNIPELTNISSTLVRQMKPIILPVWPFYYCDSLYHAVHPTVYMYMRRYRLFGFADVDLSLLWKQVAVYGSIAMWILYKRLLK